MVKTVRSLDIGGSYTKAIPVTPDDNRDFPWAARALYIGGAGNVSVIFAYDDDAHPVTLTALQPGWTHPCAVRRVLATGTTATLILALV